MLHIRVPNFPGTQILSLPICTQQEEHNASYSGYDDYLGDISQDYSPSPESQARYNEEHARCAAEYGLTPQELDEINQYCIHKQELLEQEYQEELREARETRETQREEIRMIEEAERLEYGQKGGLASEIQVGTHLPIYN